MQQSGVEIIAAHMFVFYFGIVADITPPVCLAAYAGAGIAGANPMLTGGNAVKIAIAAFIVPYIFVTNPVLLFQGATVANLIPALATALLGITVISAGMMGYFPTTSNLLERAVLLGAGVLLIYSSLPLSLAGLALTVAPGLYQYLRKRGRGDYTEHKGDAGAGGSSPESSSADAPQA